MVNGGMQRVISDAVRLAITHRSLQCLLRASSGHPGRSSRCRANFVANTYRLFHLVSGCFLLWMIIIILLIFFCLFFRLFIISG